MLESDRKLSRRDDKQCECKTVQVEEGGGEDGGTVSNKTIKTETKQRDATSRACIRPNAQSKKKKPKTR